VGGADAPDAVPDHDDVLAVHLKRYREARAAGLTIVEAKIWADSGDDVGELRRLIRLGCPADALAKILL
jgi:hypothetical protein